MKTNHFITFLPLFCFITGPVFANKKQDGQLPPGLLKKAEGGRSLPPRWQKKIVKGEPVKLGEATRDVVEVLWCNNF